MIYGIGPYGAAPFGASGSLTTIGSVVISAARFGFNSLGSGGAPRIIGSPLIGAK